MSQGSQSSFAAGRTILPLSKFSHATVHGESIIPIPWFHIGKTDNLCAIFESQRVEDSSGQAKDVKKFKVLYDPEVLEEIDLDVLATEANRARTEAQAARPNGKLPSVTIIVKIPCIAIRYPLEGGKIRRIQIRLASNDDYFETLKLLTRANVPFGDAGSYPTQPQPARPFSSSSSHLRPSDSASQLGARPVSMSSRIGDLPSVQVDAGAGWASADSVRPITSSVPAYRSPSGTISNYFGQSGRSPGLLDNSRMSFNDAPMMESSASGLVSRYFGGQKELQSLLPTQVSGLGYMGSPGRINLYQPRPSTAPIMESQTLSQMLPPKRELPFSNPAPTKKIRKNSSRLEEEQTDTGLGVRTLPPSPLRSFSKLRNSVSNAVSTMENTSEVSVNSAATVPATKGTQVAASGAPKPRAPKKQQAKAIAKKATKATKAAKERDVVPSVQQLLKETDDQSKTTVEAIATIDTQALLSRVEATRPYQTIGSPKVSQDTYAPSGLSAPVSQTTKCSGCRMRKGKCNRQDPCDWCIDHDLDCTYEAPANPAPQVLVPSSQPEAIAEAPKKANPTTDDEAAAPPQEIGAKNEAIAIAPEAAKQELPMPADHTTPVPHPQEHKPPHTPEAPPIDPGATPIDPASTRPNAGTTPALHLAPAAEPVVLLLRDAAFSQSHHLTSWANLPESVQRSTLDTWMCQQLSDPGFTALVKRLDESWQANLFGSSVGIDI